jgi:hypothetical protein
MRNVHELTSLILRRVMNHGEVDIKHPDLKVERRSEDSFYLGASTVPVEGAPK